MRTANRSDRAIGAAAVILGDVPMRRRDLLAFVVGAAGAYPLAVCAQQKAMPVIGFLIGSSPEPNSSIVVGLQQGLSETGYLEGQNVAFEYRWAEGHFECHRLVHARRNRPARPKLHDPRDAIEASGG
jgi:hypothetical protein